jgi:hypothetical protein
VTSRSAAASLRGVDWRRTAAAGAVYVLAVFAIAFAIGSVRVLWIAPRLGALVAVILEVPVVLATSWGLCRWCTRRFEIRADVRSRVAMGSVAFALLMLVEFAVAVGAFGESPAGYAAKFGTAPGVVGLLGQVGFAAVPLVQAAWSRRHLAA